MLPFNVLVSLEILRRTEDEVIALSEIVAPAITSEI